MLTFRAFLLPRMDRREASISQPTSHYNKHFIELACSVRIGHTGLVIFCLQVYKPSHRYSLRLPLSHVTPATCGISLSAGSKKYTEGKRRVFRK